MELIVPKVRGQFDQNQIFPMDIEVYKPYRSVKPIPFQLHGTDQSNNLGHHSCPSVKQV